MDRGRRLLPNIPREPEPERQPEGNNSPVESTSPSRASSVRGSAQWSNQFSASTSLSGYNSGGAEHKSPTHSLDTFRILPPSSEQTSSYYDEDSSFTSGKSLAMSPSQEKISVVQAERSSSPTKGMGGFVQSAMMKRTDSVNKRWSAQTYTGLSRQNSVVSAGGHPGGMPGRRSNDSTPAVSRNNSVDLASTRSAAQSALPNSNRFSSTDFPKPLANPNDDVFVKPSLPAHSRTKSVASNYSDNSAYNNTDDPVRGGIPSRSPSPSKRWSPTKSSWLESALKKPEMQKPKTAAQTQVQAQASVPSWMAEISRNKDRNRDRDGDKNRDKDGDVGVRGSRDVERSADGRVGDGERNIDLKEEMMSKNPSLSQGMSSLALGRDEKRDDEKETAQRKDEPTKVKSPVDELPKQEMLKEDSLFGKTNGQTLTKIHSSGIEDKSPGLKTKTSTAPFNSPSSSAPTKFSSDTLNQPTKSIDEPIASKTPSSPSIQHLSRTIAPQPLNPSLAASTPTLAQSPKSTSISTSSSSISKPTIAANDTPFSTLAKPKSNTNDPNNSSSNSNNAGSDFRSILKPRQPPPSSSQGSKPEFQNVIGNLKKTQTKNYVAPDIFKDNILRGKAALNVTGGPRKSERRDEFKESILQRKEEMKKKVESGQGVKDMVKGEKEEEVPEALTKRNALGRGGGGNVTKEEKGAMNEESGDKTKGLNISEGRDMPSSKIGMDDKPEGHDAPRGVEVKVEEAKDEVAGTDSLESTLDRQAHKPSSATANADEKNETTVPKKDETGYAHFEGSPFVDMPGGDGTISEMSSKHEPVSSAMNEERPDDDAAADTTTEKFNSLSTRVNEITEALPSVPKAEDDQETFFKATSNTKETFSSVNATVEREDRKISLKTTSYPVSPVEQFGIGVDEVTEVDGLSGAGIIVEPTRSSEQNNNRALGSTANSATNAIATNTISSAPEIQIKSTTTTEEATTTASTTAPSSPTKNEVVTHNTTFTSASTAASGTHSEPKGKPPTKTTDKLAKRLNPALAGILARGPQPSAGAITTKSADAVSDTTSTGSDNNAKDMKSVETKGLRHITKGRAKGPKRRLPTSLPNNDDAEGKRLDVSEKPEKKADEKFEEMPDGKFTNADMTTVPEKLTSLSSPLEENPLKVLSPSTSDFSTTPHSYTVETQTPPTAAKSTPDTGISAHNLKSPSSPRSPRMLDQVSSDQLCSPKFPTRTIHQTPALPPASDIAASTKAGMLEGRSPSPRSRGFQIHTPTSPLATQQFVAKGRETEGLGISPMPSPTSKDSLRRESVSPKRQEHRRTGSNAEINDIRGDVSTAIRPAATMNKAESPSKSTYRPEGLRHGVSALASPIRLRERSPPKQVDTTSTVPQIPGSPSKVPETSHSLDPSHRKVDEDKNIFADYFDTLPVTSAHLLEHIDTQAILTSNTLLLQATNNDKSNGNTSVDNSRKSRTTRMQIFEVRADGKLEPLPPQQEHVLHEQEMYACTHAFATAEGVKKTEVYLWAGSGVSESAVEDAQSFAKRMAKDNGAKLINISQGKETVEFLHALGGILITLRGVRDGHSRPCYMLCGRKYFGHVVFDEVDFALGSFCSGFPYLIRWTGNDLQKKKLFLWKGAGCTAEELGCARLISMDLGEGEELVEVEEGHEMQEFLDMFEAVPTSPFDSRHPLSPTLPTSSTSHISLTSPKSQTQSQEASLPKTIAKTRKLPPSAAYWKLKAKNQHYHARLFRIDQHPQPQHQQLQSSSQLLGVDNQGRFQMGSLWPLKRRPSWQSNSASSSPPRTPPLPATTKVGTPPQQQPMHSPGFGASFFASALRPSSATSAASAASGSTSTAGTRLVEITPFGQMDVEPESVYVLDAFFEIYM